LPFYVVTYVAQIFLSIFRGNPCWAWVLPVPEALRMVCGRFKGSEPTLKDSQKTMLLRTS
jgi:hypothetical protein